MALEQDTGEDRPSADLRGNVPPPVDTTSSEMTTAYRDPPSVVPSIIASLAGTTIPGGTYGDVPAADDSGGMTLPFIPMGMSKEQIDKLRETDARILEDEIGAKAKAISDLEKKDAEFEAQMERANRAIGYEGDHLRPWNAEREMESRKHNLWEEFGSPGFLVAMMGSAFTAMPMVSALNAGAAAMNAINQGDIDGYDKAFEAWQQNAKLTIDRMKMEQEQFNNLESLRKDNMARWKEELGLKLDQFGDRRKKALLEAGYDEEVIKASEAQEKLIGQLESNYQAHIENKALFDGVQDELKKNKNQSWFDAYAKTLEKLTRAKNAGKFGGGADGALWAIAAARHPDDLDAQLQDVHDMKEKLAVKKGAAAAVTDADRLAIKADLENALGHALSPELSASIDAGLGQKGANAARVANAITGTVDTIKSRLAAGETEEKIEPGKLISRAITAATGASARSATAAFIAQVQADPDIQKLEPKEQAEAIRRSAATFTSAMSTARTLGTRLANVKTSIEEVKILAPRAIELSDAVQRGDVTAINAIKRAMKLSVSDSNQVLFQTINAGLITAYSGTMSRTGGNTVEAQKRSQDLINTAVGTKTYKDQVRLIQWEMNAVEQGVENVLGEATAPSTTPDEDQRALEWARSHPDDPDAKAILKLHGE